MDNSDSAQEESNGFEQVWDQVHDVIAGKEWTDTFCGKHGLVLGGQIFEGVVVGSVHENCRELQLGSDLENVSIGAELADGRIENFNGQSQIIGVIPFPRSLGVGETVRFFVSQDSVWFNHLSGTSSDKFEKI